MRLLNCVEAVVLAFVLCTGAFRSNIANTRSVPDVAAAGGASGVSASSTLDATIDVFWASVPFSLQSEGAESGLSPGSALFHQAAQFLYYRPANGDKRAKYKSGAAGTAAVVALRRQPSIILLISRVRRRYGHQDERNRHRCVQDVSARVLLHGEPPRPTPIRSHLVATCRCACRGLVRRSRTRACRSSPWTRRPPGRRRRTSRTGGTS